MISPCTISYAQVLNGGGPEVDNLLKSLLTSESSNGRLVPVCGDSGKACLGVPLPALGNGAGEAGVAGVAGAAVGVAGAAGVADGRRDAEGAFAGLPEFVRVSPGVIIGGRGTDGPNGRFSPEPPKLGRMMVGPVGRGAVPFVVVETLI